MIFVYNWIQDYVKEKLPKPKELAELFSFHSFEIEGVSKKAGEDIIDIDILPNRAHDCLSHIGIAREAAALTDSEFEAPSKFAKEDSKVKANSLLQAEVKDKKDCPRYSAKIMQGIKIGRSPRWMHKRLEACGLQEINGIVDITNYIMLETGQPIHAFDADKVGSKIVVRRATKGESIKTLDNKEYNLDENVLVIADNANPIAIAGIKGGASTGIDKNTKNIIIEAANFDQGIIRKASQTLKLRTDASIRFENDISSDLIDYALERVCYLIEKELGGTVVSGTVNVGVKKIAIRKVKLDLAYVNKLLGVNIPKQNALGILNKLHFSILEKNLKTIVVGVPSQRLDISTQEDLAEEIGRVYGYGNIESVFPISSTMPHQRNSEIFWQNNAKVILRELGFFETYNYSFIGDKDNQIFNTGSYIVEIENPVSALNKYFRPSLLPNLLIALADNLKRVSEVKIFEIGKIAIKRGSIKEKNMFTVVLARKDKRDDGFFELKGVVDTIFNKFGISNVTFDEADATPEDSDMSVWHPGKMAEIKIDGKEVGFLGQVHPRIAEGYGISEKIFAIDIDFDKVALEATEENEYSQISAYPAVLRDLAVLVPRGTKTVEILNVINSAGGKIVRDVDLFDVYQGSGIADNKENFAFHIVYQSDDKTLLSSEVDKIHKRIISALEENLEWEVRK